MHVGAPPTSIDVSRPSHTNNAVRRPPFEASSEGCSLHLLGLLVDQRVPAGRALVLLVGPFICRLFHGSTAHE